MRKVEPSEITAHYESKTHNARGESRKQVKFRLEKAAAIAAIQQANSIAHLKLALVWVIEQLGET